MKFWRSVYRMILFISLCMSGYVLMNTETGLCTVFWILQRSMPLHISALSGRLLGPIHLEGLLYTTQQVRVFSSRTDFSIDWLALAHGYLRLNYLKLDSCRIDHFPKKSNHSSQFTWLKNIRVHRVSIKALWVNTPQGQLQASGQMLKHWNVQWRLTLKQAWIKNPGGRLIFQGTITGKILEPILKIATQKIILANHWQIHAVRARLAVKLTSPSKYAMQITAQQIKHVHLMAQSMQFRVFGTRTTAQAVLNTQINIPDLGLILRNIKFTAKKQADTIVWQATVQSGKGHAQFNGRTQLKANLPTSMRVIAQTLEVAHTVHYHIFAEGFVQIQADIKHMAIIGQVRIPEAFISPDHSDQDLIELSDDIVFRNAKQQASKLSITSQLRVSLGKNVKLQYSGLHSQLYGQIELKTQSGYPTLATGRIRLQNAVYTYYGQEIALQPNSAFNFSNSDLTNPDLDLSSRKTVLVMSDVLNSNASNLLMGDLSTAKSYALARRPVSITVGIHIQGPLHQPKISLFSNPAGLQPTDILSYLITGQASSELSGASSQLLLGAAERISDHSGLDLVRSLQKKIGLDQLDVSNQPIFDPNTNTLEQNTSLIIGKRLLPKLSVTYSVGLMKPITILQINYALNKYFSIQGTNSTFANGVDVLYTLERP